MRELLPWFGRLVTPELLAHVRRAGHPESLRNPALGHRRPHLQQFRQRRNKGQADSQRDVVKAALADFP